MKSFFKYVLLLALAITASCSDDKPVQHFQLTINTGSGTDSVQYQLTDSSLTILDLPGVYESRLPKVLYSFQITENDTLPLIALLDAKSYDCKEQHALNAVHVSFRRDTVWFEVDPNVNHPKEIDYAVRIINSLVPPELQLHFIDMQSAIEPNGKLQL